VRVFNFAAGPATLPLEVLEQVRGELTDWQGSGAMPVAGVDALIAFMNEFQRRNG